MPKKIKRPTPFPFPYKPRKLEQFYKYKMVPEVWKRINKHVHNDIYLNILDGKAPYITVPQKWVLDRYGPSVKAQENVRFLYRRTTKTARPWSRVFVNAVHLYEELMGQEEIVDSFSDWHNWAILITTPLLDPLFRVVRDRENLKNFRGYDFTVERDLFSSSRAGIKKMLEDGEDLKNMNKVIRVRSLNVPGRL